MAQREITYTVTDENRDKGKVFVIVEKDPHSAEKWALKFISGLAASGIDVPEIFHSLAGIAEFGLSFIFKMKWEYSEPLLDEMMECVKFIPDPSNMLKRSPLSFSGGCVIEEVTTIFKLRAEIIKLHIDFSPAAKP